MLILGLQYSEPSSPFTVNDKAATALVPAPEALCVHQGGIGGFGKQEWQEQAGLSHVDSADRWGRFVWFESWHLLLL